MGSIPQGWAAAFFHVMENQVFSSFLSKNTCLQLGICSQTQERADLGLRQDRGHQEAPSGSQLAGVRHVDWWGLPGPAAGSRHPLAWVGLGSKSEKWHQQSPGSWHAVPGLRMPKRGHPGDSMYMRETQDRAPARECGWGFVRA